MVPLENLLISKFAKLINDGEGATKAWHKTGSKEGETNQGQGVHLLWKMIRCLKWLNNSQVQALVHCRENLALHKAVSIGTSISSTLRKDDVQTFLLN